MLTKPFLGALAALTLTFGAQAVQASDAATIQQSSSELPVPVYPVNTGANYCPAGLQPVTIDGSTSCGTPNQEVTYQQNQATPYRRSYSYSYGCPVGTKGCN